MHIAQVAPLTEAIPPKLYGGTERVVSWLTEELIALGHEVTLFASGDSVTSARLEAVWPRALRLDGSVRDPNALHMLMLAGWRVGLKLEGAYGGSHKDRAAAAVLRRLHCEGVIAGKGSKVEFWIPTPV